MSRIFHVWWLLIIVLIIGAIIVLYGLFNTSQQLSADTLYDAVRDSAEYSRDDSQRESRGTFVINTDAFRKELANYKIKDIGAVGSGSEGGTFKHEGNTQMYIHYLIDNKNSDNGNKGVKNGYVDSTAYSRYAKYRRNGKLPKYLPVRAIQVQAVVFNKNIKGEKRSHSIRYNEKDRRIRPTGSKYVTTLVVQNQKGIRVNKYLKKDNDDIDTQLDNDKGNTPVRKSNRTDKKAEDVTDPSYYGSEKLKNKKISTEENGNSDKLSATNRCQDDTRKCKTLSLTSY